MPRDRAKGQSEREGGERVRERRPGLDHESFRKPNEPTRCVLRCFSCKHASKLLRT